MVVEESRGTQFAAGRQRWRAPKRCLDTTATHAWYDHNTTSSSFDDPHRRKTMSDPARHGETNGTVHTRQKHQHAQSLPGVE